MTEQVG